MDTRKEQKGKDVIFQAISYNLVSNFLFQTHSFETLIRSTLFLEERKHLSNPSLLEPWMNIPVPF